MKKIVFIHGYASKEVCERLKPLNIIGWFGWLQEKLKNKYKIFAPLVPEIWEGKYENWKKTFQNFDFDENTIVVAHSAGVSFIIRFLGENNLKLEKLILVSPAKIVGEDETLKDFYNFEINENIKNRVKSIEIIVGEDDEQRHKDSAKIFQQKLNGNLRTLKGKGHFIQNDFEEILEYFKDKENIL